MNETAIKPATKLKSFFPIPAEKLETWMEESWVLFASGKAPDGDRMTFKVQTGKPVALIHKGDSLLHKGDIDYGLQLFNQNVKHD
jgi:hypothetical protein